MNKKTLRSVVVVALSALGFALVVAACGDGQETTATVAGETPASGSIVVSGLVDYPMTFVTLDTDYMDWATVTADDPEVGSTTYDGVRLSEVFSYVGVQTEAATVLVVGSDRSSVELTLADISADALITVTPDGAFDLVMPGMSDDAWIDDVVGMEFR